MNAVEAARGMRVPEGFQVTLFAAEPEVRNPIAMAWDDKGRMWVAENYTYSDRSQRFDLSLRDRVVIFEDTNADGTADSRRVFTENVQMLTSVEIGRGGVWLMCPPQLLFFPDADQDGTADGPAQTVLDGFTVATDNYHNYANGLRWGPDGWLYGRCGHSCPGRIGVPGTPDSHRVPLEGGLWRFHPERQIVEVLCHGTVNPWGHDWDRNGQLFFINTVIGHLWHVTPGAHFRESFGESLNPDVYERLDMIADHYHFDTRNGPPNGPDDRDTDFGGGHAHVGMMIYQNSRWPGNYRDRLFTLNLHGRRVNVERLERTGAGYTGRHEPDFLVSPDPFFRGLEISTGPDGNVFILDWSDTGECHEHDGVHRSSGRIFRIASTHHQPPSSFSKPACLAGDGPLPELWKQYQAGIATHEMLTECLRHDDEHVRVQGIRLLTDFWPLDTIVGPQPDAVYPVDPEVLAQFAEMATTDPSGLVLLTLASTLQRLPLAERERLALNLLQRTEFAHDRDLPAMLWYGLMPMGQQTPEALVRVGVACRIPSTLRWVSRKLASLSREQPGLLNSLLRELTTVEPELKEQVLSGMKEAFRGWRKVTPPESFETFAAGLQSPRSEGLLRELRVLFGEGRALAEVRNLALDGQADLKSRESALLTLIESDTADLREVCGALLKVRPLNRVAAQGLTRFEDPQIARLLIENYRRFDVADRPGIVSALVSRTSFATVLLNSIGSGSRQIPLTDVSAIHARQVQSLGQKDLNRKLADVWGDLNDSPADKSALIAKLRADLQPARLQGANLPSGRLLFRKTCGQCHLLFGDGGRIGPDLTGSQRSSIDYLLQNILEPHAIVPANYRMSVIALKDGRVLNGILTRQTDDLVTVGTATGLQELPRRDIEEMQNSSLSLMPDNLLQPLSDDQIRDLMAYLMHPVQVDLPNEGP